MYCLEGHVQVIRDPQQRQILESYILDSRIGPAELAQFAGLYPNANYMISQNLLTPAPAPETLRLMRETVAPALAPTYPKFAAAVFGIARPAEAAAL